MLLAEPVLQHVFHDRCHTLWMPKYIPLKYLYYRKHETYKSKQNHVMNPHGFITQVPQKQPQFMANIISYLQLPAYPDPENFEATQNHTHKYFTHKYLPDYYRAERNTVYLLCALVFSSKKWNHQLSMCEGIYILGITVLPSTLS